jgi:hypothetical protein
MDKRLAGVAALFAAIGIAGLAALNFFFSPGYIWFYYAAFVLLWWPLAAFLVPHRSPVAFSLAGSAMTAVFLAAVNLQNSPGHPWFLWTVYPLAWWPVSVYFSTRRQFKGLAVAGCVLTVAYFVALNLVFSPSCPWYLYACWPVLWWPVVMYLGRKAGTLTFACICSALTIAYYAALNVFLSPGFPWAICPAFAILWWPISMVFARKKQWLGYSIAAATLSALFFVALNLAASPGVHWAFYPIFAVLWWPMTMLFAKHKAWFGYSIAASALTFAFLLAINLLYSPGVLWVIFPLFALLWWPMSLFFARRGGWFGYSVAGTLLISALLAATNWMFSPAALWAVYPIFGVIWWPLAMYFFRYRKARMA